MDRILIVEITNPLIAVNAYLHVLQRDFPDTGEPVKELIAAIKIEAERIAAITATLAEATSAATSGYNRDIKMIDLSRCSGES